MKKFAIFVMILIVTISLGVTVFYFAKDKEELIINSDAEIFVNQGATVKFDVTLKYAKSGHTLSIKSLNPNVLEDLGDGVVMGFSAEEGGAAIVEISVTGSKSINPTYIVVNVGNGNPSTPFYVDSEETLKEVASNDVTAGKNYLLLNDISLNDNFTPLNAFSGTLNGNGYTISNLTITAGNTTSSQNAGLFSEITSTGVVTNLNIKSVNINGQFKNVGAIAGVNNGTISRCSVTDGVIISTLSEANVGGICGKTVYSTTSTGRIDRTYSALTIQAQATNSNVGGLTGLNEGGIVINSYTTKFSTDDIISVSAINSNVGGLIGYNKYFVKDNVDKLATVKNCYSNASVDIGNVDASKVNMAGLIGYNEDVDDKNLNRIMGCYYNSDVVSVGMNNKYEASYNSSTKVQEQANYRGIYVFSFDANNNIIKESLKSYYSSDDINNMIKWDFENVWKLSASVNNGYPSLNTSGSDVPDDIAFLYTPSSISGVGGLDDLRQQVANGTLTNGGYYKLTSNITLSGDFTPIGTKEKPFTGTFDGNGYTIYNLTINGTTASEVKYVGLFGYISSSARIKNVKIENVVISAGATHAGAVVGYSEDGTISNCSVNNTTNAQNINILASRSAGGIVGTSEGVVENCSVENTTIVVKKTGTATTDYEKQRYAGGIVGENGVVNTAKSATIKDCKVVDSKIYDDYGTEVGLKSKSYGEVNFYKFDDTCIYIAGIAGSSNYKVQNSVVSNCTITADATDDTVMVAGIVSQSKTTLRGKTEAEVYLNAVYDSTLKGFCVGGVIGRIHGLADQNACIGGTITGFYSAGVVVDIKLGAKVINCVAGSVMNSIVSSSTRRDLSCNGLFVHAEFDTLDNMGEMYNCFAYCTFNADSADDNYYDSNSYYKWIGDWFNLKREQSRMCGKADYLLFVETGNAKAQNSTWLGLGTTTVKNTKGLTSEEATADPTTLMNLMNEYKFDVVGDSSIWVVEVGEYPALRNIPKNPKAE